jgi:copper resistance protein B
VRWSKKFGNTAEFARAEGEDVSDTQLVLGIEAWF